MAIYRGAGGAGDSNTDATLLEVTEQAVIATTKASDAAASASAAATSETNAATSATASASSATAAASSASGVSASATAAANSATAAANSATAAATAETNAETAETNAETAESNASTSATTATTKAAEAATSATSASTSASTATTKVAFKNKGVQAVLDAVIDYMPAPTEVKAIDGVLENGDQVTCEVEDDAPFAALAFKIATDPFVGTLTFFRVYSGKLNSGDSVYNPLKSKKERVGRMVQMHANSREEIKEVLAGDIAAAIGLKDVTTGETLCAIDRVVTLEKMEFPEPVISVAVEPKSKADQEKMGIALGKLAQEDPSFRVETDEESGQTIISGMGELHLDVLVDRMRREFAVEANIGKPQVAYRETIRKSVEIEGKHVKQSGGRGQYGHVVLRLEPLDPDAEYEFVNEIVGGVTSDRYVHS